MKESINVKFDDNLDSPKSKQCNIFPDIEIQFTGTEDIASEVLHKESQSNPKEDVTNITTTFE